MDGDTRGHATRNPGAEKVRRLVAAINALPAVSQQDLTWCPATDPDADRLGALVPSGPQGAGLGGGWRYVNGNEIAALLTHFKLSKLAEQGRLPSSPVS